MAILDTFFVSKMISFSVANTINAHFFVAKTIYTHFFVAKTIYALFCHKKNLGTLFLSQKRFTRSFLSSKRFTHFLRKVFAGWKLPSGKFILFGPLRWGLPGRRAWEPLQRCWLLQEVVVDRQGFASLHLDHLLPGWKRHDQALWSVPQGRRALLHSLLFPHHLVWRLSLHHPLPLRFLWGQASLCRSLEGRQRVRRGPVDSGRVLLCLSLGEPWQNSKQVYYIFLHTLTHTRGF